MGKRIVLAGGGHAHMTVMVNSHVFQKEGHQVTLISPSPHHYYSGMGPGNKPQEIRFNVQKMIETRNGRFVQDRVIRIDTEQKRLILNSGSAVDYDVASFNVGSAIPSDFAGETGENVFSVKPIINLLKAREVILRWPEGKSLKILVAGGGPAGVEIVGNLWRLTRNRKAATEIILVAGTKLLKRCPEKVYGIARKSLNRRGIDVIEGAHVAKTADGEVMLTDGRKIDYNIAFLSSGVKPPSLFRDSGIPAEEDGGMLVNQYLQSISHPEIFGGGDCISLQGHRLEKVGVYAVRENPVLFHNLLAFAQGEKLKPFDPGGSYLLIFNLGDSTGIFWRGSSVWNGRPAFFLKDFIDRRFMRKFQVSGERDEEL
ncbi:MAG: hypothetical protein AMK71_03730 [Nitrospira bacterium SG8_35_4]|nr:MAG: hypothetical protein AMK71_03730 [Nitrospira bacterium SG8_35_4]